MKKSNKKGFTIVELVIVIAVIAILAAVLIPTFSNVISKANDSAALQSARNEYTAYLASVDAKDVSGLVSGTYVIEADTNRFFVVKAGQFDTTVYTSKEDTNLVNAIKVENKTQTIEATASYTANGVSIYAVSYADQ